MKEYPVWGVDITPVAIRGVKLELSPEGKPRLSAWDIVDFTEQVEEVTSVSRFNTIARKLYYFRSRHDLRFCRVWVSMRSETAFNRTVVVPPISDESLDRILEYEAQQQIPFPLEEVYWDRRGLAIRENGEVVATLYAIPRNIVEDRMRRLSRSGLPIDGLQLRAVALQNYCAFERLLDPGTVIIDVDFAGLQVLIHHDDQTWFRVLPTGGVDFVENLQAAFRCDHAVAVRLASGDSRPRDVATYESIRRETADHLAAEAGRLVRYYLAAHPGLRGSGVVLFESHPCVPPMAEAIKKELGLPVHRPRGFRHIEVDPEVVTAGIQEHFPALARAAGLALQGLGKAEVEVRLFDPNLTRRMTGSRAGYYVAVVLVLFFVAVVGWRHRARATALNAEITALTEVLSRVQDRDELERTVDVGKPAADMEKLLRPVIGQDRPLRIYERIVTQVGAWTEGPAPQVAAVRIDESPTGELVLLLPETQKAEDLDATLDRFAATIPDGAAITAVKPVDSWSAGAPAAEPEVRKPDRLLRWRLRHRRYALQLGGSGP